MYAKSASWWTQTQNQKKYKKMIWWNTFTSNNIHVSDIHCRCGSAVRFGQALLGLLITAPSSVCVSALLGALTVWIQNQKIYKKNDSSSPTLVLIWWFVKTWQVTTYQVIWRGARGQGDKSTWEAQLVKFHLCPKHKCRTLYIPHCEGRAFEGSGPQSDLRINEIELNSTDV